MHCRPSHPYLSRSYFAVMCAAALGLLRRGLHLLLHLLEEVLPGNRTLALVDDAHPRVAHLRRVGGEVEAGATRVAEHEPPLDAALLRLDDDHLGH
eukprot:2312655-Prymnesium_polylepis.1